MEQLLLKITVPRELELDIQRALTSAGFAVNVADRMVRALTIRVRANTSDEAEALGIVTRLAPEAVQLPSGAPVTTLRGYREGR